MSDQAVNLTQQLPDVTVVIANHNYGRWLGDAIRSVDAQDYPKKRIIVVDDGSTDNSWDVLRMNAGVGQLLVGKPNTAYPGKVGNTPLFAVHLPKAGGPSRARNIAIKLAWQSTHLYSILDADDVFLPGKLSKSVSRLMEDPKHIGAVYTDYETVSIDTGVAVREYKEPYTRERLLRECMVHSACVISRLALEKVGVYDEDMRTCEDYDLWVRLAEKFIISHIPECLMRVRVGSHNSTATVAREVWEQNWRRIAQKTQERQNGRSANK